MLSHLFSVFFISSIISFSFPTADVLIIAPFPWLRFSFTSFISLSCSFLSSIFWDIVIISVFGINAIYLLGRFMCVDTLAPFWRLLSFFTCTNIFCPSFITSLMSISLWFSWFFMLFCSFFSLTFSSISFRCIKLFFSVPMSTNADCIPFIIFLTTPI